MSFAKKIFFFSIIIALVVILFTFWRSKIKQSDKSDLKKAYVGKDLVWVKIARTDQERKQGLSGVEKLAENEGMLFILPEKQIPNFWMKEMNFALDFVWIANNKVVDISENVPAPAPNSSSDKIARVQPKMPVDMVLEINTGWVKKHKVKIGGELLFEELVESLPIEIFPIDKD